MKEKPWQAALAASAATSSRTVTQRVCLSPAYASFLYSAVHGVLAFLACQRLCKNKAG